MQSDHYIKVILTIIAVALCVDVASRAVTPALAATPAPAITRVALCDITNPNQCADILFTSKMVVDPTTGLATQTRRGVGVFQQ